MHRQKVSPFAETNGPAPRRPETNGQAPPRRGGLSPFSGAYSLKPIGLQPTKGCLKILTLEDSLRLIDEKERRERSMRRVSKRVSLSRIAHLLGESPVASRRTGRKLASSLPSPRLSRKPKVRFDRIEVREYEILPGDNPCVSAGVPLSIGWDYTSAMALDVDAYESNRGPRRKMEEIKLTDTERRERLRATGVSEDELRKVVAITNKARERRLKTLEDKKPALEFQLSGIASKMRKVLGRRQKEEGDLWDDAQRRKHRMKRRNTAQ